MLIVFYGSARKENENYMSETIPPGNSGLYDVTISHLDGVAGGAFGYHDLVQLLAQPDADNEWDAVKQARFPRARSYLYNRGRYYA
jgi:hypothetical protein